MTQVALQVVFLPVRLVAGGNVDKRFESAPELYRVGDHHVPDTDKTTKNKKGKAVFVEMLSVNF